MNRDNQNIVNGRTMGENTGRSVVSERVFKWWDYLLFSLLTGLIAFGILYFFSYWLSFQDWLKYPVIYSALSLLLILFLSNNLGRWFLLPYMRRPLPMKARSNWKVGVATTFVPGMEPLDMLEETLQALIAMRYPHDTWVLDEGDDDDVRELCQRLGVNHFSRKTFPQYQTENGIFQAGSKHGNYNAWLYEIGFERYEVIATFDPDHVPAPSFLTKVLGYLDDPNVGYVQVAQTYYNQGASFIARGAAEKSYGYYSSIQMAGYGLGYPMIIGCHNTHRVRALKEIGGFAPHDADDVLITRFYRECGWHGVYVPEILASGLAPVDWSGYLNQQRRWARSALDLQFRVHSTRAGILPIKNRLISFFHAIQYLHRSCSICLGLILMTFMLATGTTPVAVSQLTLTKVAILYAPLQLCQFYRQRFYLDPSSQWGWHWRAGLLQFAQWPYLLLALFDVILGRQVPYTLTRKVRTTSRHDMLLWPHMLVGTLICVAWIMGAVSGRIINPFVHTIAATIVIVSVALVVTERRTFPDPYNQNYFQPSP